jgi:menaquinone-dependent protoporphyrinogen oxidase
LSDTVTSRALVAYGSRHGSTAQIAEAIAATLRQEGVEVDVLPAGEVASLEPYPAVILGSAVYGGRWCHDALTLLRRPQLAGRDVWLFSSGPVGHSRGPRLRRVERRASELGAHEHIIFGGAIAEVGGLLRRRIARHTPAELRDRRDWPTIETWSRMIAATLVRRAA